MFRELELNLILQRSLRAKAVRRSPMKRSDMRGFSDVAVLTLLSPGRIK